MEIKFAKKQDRNRITDFYKIVFGDEIESSLNNRIFNSPFNNINDFSYIEEGGKIISMMGIIEHVQRFGEREIKVGEINFVGTHPYYRKKGLIKKLMNYWIEEMKKRNIPLSFLFGIADFYQQFGFEYACPVHFYNYITLEKIMLKNIKSEYKIELLDIKDERAISEINNIYAEESVDNFCSKIRGCGYFSYRIKMTSKNDFKWYVVKNNNAIKGYMWLQLKKNKIVVREANVLDEKAAASLCEKLNELAENKNFKIGVKAPLNSKFSRYVYKKGARFACNNEIYYGSWAGMYKIVNLKSVLEILIPSFEKRLSNSRFYDYTKAYKISTDIGDAIIKLEHGKVNILNVGQSDSTIIISSNVLTQLLTGYKDLSYFEDKISFNSDEDKAVFKVLFPLEFPYIYDLEYSDEL
ncbi:GNAT family N-acetyltransferase [Clostridium hydrogenum]|uniref:GNAT family N-acetyltransferase n=1 Tax=Clostridium hydrogenum TaxID=2855764 RepID=UPI002E32B20C|nr:GNAT family N-acetyltransferase [Clostridium hydrogenum]